MNFPHDDYKALVEEIRKSEIPPEGAFTVVDVAKDVFDDFDSLSEAEKKKIISRIRDKLHNDPDVESLGEFPMLSGGGRMKYYRVRPKE